MTEIEDEKSDAGIILQEIQAGYMFGERLLRPALVGVSKKKIKKLRKMDKKRGLRGLVDRKRPPYKTLEG